MTEPGPATATPDRATLAARVNPGFWGLAWRRYRRHPTGMIGLALFAAMMLVALFTPFFAGRQPLICSYEGEIHMRAVIEPLHKIPGAEHVVSVSKPFRYPSFSPREAIDEAKGDWAVWPLVPWGPNETNPLGKLKAPSEAHLLGTDDVGRDVLSRMIHATPIALMIGFVAMGIATVIGLTAGALAGYLGGRVDIGVSRVIEVFICVPVFYVILIALLVAEPSIWNVMIVLGLFSWTGIARYTRAEMMKLQGQDYALAARALGASTPRIVFRHLLPNALAPVLVVVAFGVAGAIFVESGLSWLGFGVQPPQATWGSILRTGWDNLRAAPHIIFPPSAAIFIAVLTMNLIGDALRDVTDPRLTGSA